MRKMTNEVDYPRIIDYNRTITSEIRMRYDFGRAETIPVEDDINSFYITNQADFPMEYVSYSTPDGNVIDSITLNKWQSGGLNVAGANKVRLQFSLPETVKVQVRTNHTGLAGWTSSKSYPP